jgi:hypothetical protein
MPAPPLTRLYAGWLSRSHFDSPSRGEFHTPHTPPGLAYGQAVQMKLAAVGRVDDCLVPVLEDNTKELDSY